MGLQRGYSAHVLLMFIFCLTTELEPYAWQARVLPLHRQGYDTPVRYAYGEVLQRFVSHRVWLVNN